MKLGLNFSWHAMAWTANSGQFAPSKIVSNLDSYSNFGTRCAWSADRKELHLGLSLLTKFHNLSLHLEPSQQVWNTVYHRSRAEFDKLWFLEVASGGAYEFKNSFVYYNSRSGSLGMTSFPCGWPMMFSITYMGKYYNF